MLEEFALCDSYRDSLIILKNAISDCDSLQEADLKLINNLKSDIKTYEREGEQRTVQIISLEKRNEIYKNENKRLKRRQWVVGGISGAVGVLVGIVIGLFGG